MNNCIATAYPTPGTGIDPGTAAGQMLYFDGADWVYIDNMLWDNTNKNLTITSVNGPQQKWEYSPGIESTWTTGSDGVTTLATTGGRFNIYADIATDQYLNNDTNTFLGINSGSSSLLHTTSIEGWHNTGIGALTLNLLTTGFRNTGVGQGSLNSTTTGDDNAGLGSSSLVFNTTGSRNLAIGYASLYSNTSANNNVGVGSNTLFYNRTGGSNIAIGYLAGFGVLNSSDISLNTIIGIRAGIGLLTGANNNVLIGTNAGDNITTGADNIIIGYDVDATTATTSNELNIGNLISGDLSSKYVDFNYTKGSIFARLQVGADGITTLATTGNSFKFIAGANEIARFTFDTVKKIGFLGKVTTPVAAAAHIPDADGTLAGNQTAINAILVALENVGLVLDA